MEDELNLSESYDGIAAMAWDWMGGDAVQADFDFYRRKIEALSGTALDLTCGTGRHLLRYLKAGLDVEGVDASAAMLARCRHKAQEQGLAPALYQQSMQTLDLPRNYSTIFITGGSFQLLADRSEATQVLHRLYNHLEPGGQLLIETFIPDEAYNVELDKRLGQQVGAVADWGPNVLPDGSSVTVQVWMDEIDRYEQVKTEKRRYELSRDGVIVRKELHRLHLRWYYKHELTLMLEQAGFHDIFIYGNYTDEAATSRSSETVYSAQR